MDVYKLFLIVHIFAGSIGLIAGTIVVGVKKGNDFHRFLGNIFFYSMLFAGVSAFVLSILKSTVFLFIVGVFTVYMVLTGKSYLYYKKNKSSKIRSVDKLVFLLMSLTVIAFVLFGIKLMFEKKAFAMVFFVFAFISYRFLQTDYKFFKSDSANRKDSIAIHLQRMMGAYIASTTAFLVVNVKYIPFEIPGFIWWLLPTAIFTPLIVKWSKKNSSKKPSNPTAQ
jgi:uncharacterized membrane protein